MDKYNYGPKGSLSDFGQASHLSSLDLLPHLKNEDKWYPKFLLNKNSKFLILKLSLCYDMLNNKNGIFFLKRHVYMFIVEKQKENLKCL